MSQLAQAWCQVGKHGPFPPASPDFIPALYVCDHCKLPMCDTCRAAHLVSADGTQADYCVTCASILDFTVVPK